MKKTILALIFLLLGSPKALFSQTIYKIDSSGERVESIPNKAKTLTDSSPVVQLSVDEYQLVDDLTATIEAVLFENGEHINIAKQRGVPCLKADADIPTFLKFTQSENDKKKVIADCHEAQLIRFSFFNDKDFDLAKSIDFGILNQMPQLKYLVFYVDPSVYKQHGNEQEAMILLRLEGFIKNKIENNSLKIFYRIPRGQ